MSAAEKQELPYITWDQTEIINAIAKEIREEEPELTEEQAWERVGDMDLEDEWDFVIESLTQKMDEYNPDGQYWIAFVENFGWRNIDGRTDPFEALTGDRLLRKVLPDTQCTFHIWVDDKEKAFRLRNWHHDSPTGNEFYNIRLATEEEIEEYGTC